MTKKQIYIGIGLVVATAGGYYLYRRHQQSLLELQQQLQQQQGEEDSQGGGGGGGGGSMSSTEAHKEAAPTIKPIGIKSKAIGLKPIKITSSTKLSGIMPSIGLKPSVIGSSGAFSSTINASTPKIATTVSIAPKAVSFKG